MPTLVDVLHAFVDAVLISLIIMHRWETTDMKLTSDDFALL